MLVSTWNRLVGIAIALQVLGCVAILLLTNHAELMAAAMTWMVIGCPCMFGFVIMDDGKETKQ